MSNVSLPSVPWRTSQSPPVPNRRPRADGVPEDFIQKAMVPSLGGVNAELVAAMPPVPLSWMAVNPAQSVVQVAPLSVAVLAARDESAADVPEPSLNFQ